MKNSKSSLEVLSDSPQLNKLINKIAYLTNLNILLRQQLPDLLAQHCTVANVRDNVLILHIDAATWGMQLRYLIPELLTKLRNKKNFAGISSIEYKIRPVEQTAATPANKKPFLSASNKLLLNELKQLLIEGK